MGDLMGAEFFAIPGLVVFAATEGRSSICRSGTAKLEHMGDLMGPIFPEVSAPSAELIDLGINLLLQTSFQMCLSLIR